MTEEESGALCCQFFQHTLPAHCCDTALWLLGRKQFMVRLVQRMHKGSQAVEYFAVNEWEWDQTNVSHLTEELGETDKYKFYFDVSLINWEEYLEDYIKGTRQYYFKEDLSTMEEARKHQTKMFWVDKAFQGCTGPCDGAQLYVVKIDLHLVEEYLLPPVPGDKPVEANHRLGKKRDKKEIRTYGN